MQAVHVKRFITTRPDSHGNLKAELANGRTINLPETVKAAVMQRSAKEAKELSPDTVITGNCGSSMVELQPKENDHPVEMITGFAVDSPALAYSWTVHITGPDYSYDYNASGTLAFDSTWNGSHDSEDDYEQGYYTATVTTGSYAALEDGSICYSAGPVAAETVTSPDAPEGWHLWDGTPIDSARKAATRTTILAPRAGAGLYGRNNADAPAQKADVFVPVAPVTAPSAYPNTAVARVYVTWPNGTTGYCSAFMYAAGMAATAGHCVYDPTSGWWATKITVLPGVLPSGLPYGYCTAIDAYSSTGWVQNGDLDYDYGAVSLESAAGQRTGVFPLLPPTHQGDAPPSPLTVNGYAGGADSSDLTQLTGTAAPTFHNERYVNYPIITLGGMSGGPVYTNDDTGVFAVGIHVRGDGTSWAEATRITQANLVDFNRWAQGEL